MIADAMQKVGNEGVITVEEAKTAETELDVVEGMEFDRGYLSPYFITNAEKMMAELEDPYILIHEKKLSSLQPMLPILEAVVQAGKPLLIIAEDIEGEALATLVVNKLRGGLKVARSRPRLRRPPQGDAGGHRRPHRGHDDRQGARHQARERHAADARQSQARRIEKENTTIINGAGSKKDIEAASPRSRRRLRRRPPTTTRRSCRSGWRSSPAASKGSQRQSAEPNRLCP